MGREPLFPDLISLLQVPSHRFPPVMSYELVDSNVEIGEIELLGVDSRVVMAVATLTIRHFAPPSLRHQCLHSSRPSLGETSDQEGVLSGCAPCLVPQRLLLPGHWVLQLVGVSLRFLRFSSWCLIAGFAH